MENPFIQPFYVLIGLNVGHETADLLAICTDPGKLIGRATGVSETYPDEFDVFKIERFGGRLVQLAAEKDAATAARPTHEASKTWS